VGVVWVTRPNFELSELRKTFERIELVSKTKFGSDIEYGRSLRTDYKTTPNWQNLGHVT